MANKTQRDAKTHKDTMVEHKQTNRQNNKRFTQQIERKGTKKCLNRFNKYHNEITIEKDHQATRDKQQTRHKDTMVELNKQTSKQTKQNNKR